MGREVNFGAYTAGFRQRGMTSRAPALSSTLPNVVNKRAAALADVLSTAAHHPDNPGSSTHGVTPTMASTMTTTAMEAVGFLSDSQYRSYQVVLEMVADMALRGFDDQSRAFDLLKIELCLFHLLR